MDQTALYQVLAKALLSTCPEGFEEARIEAEVESDWSEKAYRCKVGGEWSQGKSVPAELDFEVDDALHDLRKGMRQEGRAAWNRCTFVLQPDGRFDLQVAYPE